MARRHGPESNTSWPSCAAASSRSTHAWPREKRPCIPTVFRPISSGWRAAPGTSARPLVDVPGQDSVHLDIVLRPGGGARPAQLHDGRLDLVHIRGVLGVAFTAAAGPEDGERRPDGDRECVYRTSFNLRNSDHRRANVSSSKSCARARTDSSGSTRAYVTGSRLSRGL